MLVGSPCLWILLRDEGANEPRINQCSSPTRYHISLWEIQPTLGNADSQSLVWVVFQNSLYITESSHDLSQGPSGYGSKLLNLQMHDSKNKHDITWPNLWSLVLHFVRTGYIQIGSSHRAQFVPPFALGKPQRLGHPLSTPDGFGGFRGWTLTRGEWYLALGAWLSPLVSPFPKAYKSFYASSNTSGKENI